MDAFILQSSRDYWRPSAVRNCYIVVLEVSKVTSLFLGIMQAALTVFSLLVEGCLAHIFYTVLVSCRVHAEQGGSEP